ncbi:PPOX class F420-dependent oxidoreductase [Salinifilum ghardaiensis]
MSIPSSHADLLDKPGFVHVATLGPGGEPQSTPVWYDTDGEFIKISQTTGRQKYRNLQRDPRVALSVTDPDNPYRYLEIRGRVERFEDDSDNAFINSLARKYLGQEEYPYHQPGDERVTLYILPQHTTRM